MSPSVRARLAPADPTVYPVDDDVGEELLQRLIAELLRPLVAKTRRAATTSSVRRSWLRAVGEGPATRLRLAVDARGDDLLPTDAELAAGADAERAARKRADAELVKLKALLARSAPARRRGR